MQEMPPDPLEGRVCSVSSPLTAYFYISATYFDSYWKPWANKEKRQVNW